MVVGAASMIGVMGTVFLLPPALAFALIFGLMIGLPLSNALYFAEVSLLEKKVGGEIYSVTEESEADEVAVLRKSFEIWNRP